MATRTGRYFAKALAGVFTSVVAPMLVNLAVRDLSCDGPGPGRNGQARSPNDELRLPTPGPTPARALGPRVKQPPSRSQTSSSAVQPSSLTQVCARGEGRTPDEALRDALRTALYQVCATQVDADTWSGNWRVLFEDVWANQSSILRSRQEVGSTWEWRLTGTLYHKEVAVEVDRQALVDRLHAVLHPNPYRGPGWGYFAPVAHP